MAWGGAGVLAASDPSDEIVGYDGRPDAFIKLKVSDFSGKGKDTTYQLSL